MIVTCLGHAKFLLELDKGLRIVTDPYDDQSGYPVTPVNADVVLVSHGHHDHNAVETIGGNPRILREAGVTTLAPDVRVTALSLRIMITYTGPSAEARCCSCWRRKGCGWRILATGGIRSPMPSAGP